MNIKVIAGDITRIETDAVIVNYFEGMERLDGDIAAVDKALAGAISQLISQGEIKGKLNEVTIVHSLGRLPPARVVVAGLGKQHELVDKVIAAGAEVYSFRKHITKAAEYGEINQLAIVTADEANLPSLVAGYRKGRILAEAANLARDMVNEPANCMTPHSYG